jgi:hypothetical protein
MAKSKPKKITVGARVQLKNDKQTDGVVMSVVGKAKWRVRWDEGKQQGTVAEQSSKSLRLWQFNLADFDAGDAHASDSSEDEPVEPTNHPALKRKFEAYAAQLEGTKVVVRELYLGRARFSCLYLTVFPLYRSTTRVAK